MTTPSAEPMRIAVACGGTGGHLFPGMAVAERLQQCGCDVTLLVSPKDVDQQAVKMATGMRIITLPAIGLTPGRYMAFTLAFWKSYRMALSLFRSTLPKAVLAMGGFTSAPPVLAGKRAGALTFLHESNTIPGRANRWLAWFVDGAFVGFGSAVERLHNKKVTVTGTPVRTRFQLPLEPARCRTALGLEAAAPMVLVMGGSQGARGINDLVIRMLPIMTGASREWQWLHLTGPADLTQIKAAYSKAALKAVVHPFLAEMELAFGAATAAIGRAGASSLAELAAARLPAVLVPYPAATDNHQYHNAEAYEQTGAARLLDQNSATPEQLLRLLLEMMQDSGARKGMRDALAEWDAPQAAERIAQGMLRAIGAVAEPENRVVPNPTGKRKPGEPSSNVAGTERRLLART